MTKKKLKKTAKSKPVLKKKAVVKKVKPASHKKTVLKTAKKAAVKADKPKILKAKVPLKLNNLKENIQKEPMQLVNREPVRKIISSNGVIKVIKKSDDAAVLQENSVEAVKVVEIPLKETARPVVEAKAAEKKVVPVTADKKSMQKYAWDALPKYLPGQVRFLIKSSQNECHKADSPFPFSKFISSLPQAICGLEFAFLILSLEHSDEAISVLCKMNAENVTKILENACYNFSEKFSSECQDMTRKLRTQLAGSGLDMDSLFEQFFIQKADKNFQIMLGAVILKSLGVKTLNYQPTAIAS